MGSIRPLVTTTLLLEQLKNSRNEDAWQEFDDRFRGVILAAARRLGLDQADAADVAQDTILQSIRDYQAGRYDRSRGRLSSWIVTIAHNRITDALRKRQVRQGDTGGTALLQLPAASQVADTWDETMRESIFQRALDLVRDEGRLGERTLRAFEMFALRGVPAEAVAVECEMTTDQVYVAKNRAARRLREMVERLSAAYEDGL